MFRSSLISRRLSGLQDGGWVMGARRRDLAAVAGALLVALVILGLILRATGHWPVHLTAFDVHQFLLNTLDGLTAGAVYFLVASGFTLIFGLMRVVNLAHGSFYLLGGYVAWSLVDLTGNWILGVSAAALLLALIGMLMQQSLLRPLQNDIPGLPAGAVIVCAVAAVISYTLTRFGDMSVPVAVILGIGASLVIAGFFVQQRQLRATQNRDLREALVTIGFSIVAADLMLGHFGGLTYTLTPPDSINGAIDLSWLSGIINHLTSLQVDDIIYPGLRLFVLGLAAAVFIFLLVILNLTRLGMIVRAAIDDRDMVSALGINTQVIFVLLFGLGAALAGLAGGVEGTLTSVSITDDGTYLLWSLIVVIIGGLGSIGGAAIGAVIIGLVEQYGLAYSPTNAETIIFVIMVIVLALRPQGLLGRPG